jgi:hypothetical protein
MKLENKCADSEYYIEGLEKCNRKEYCTFKYYYESISFCAKYKSQLNKIEGKQ